MNELQFRCGTRSLTLGTRTLVMGILNLTPDSFSDGGSYTTLEAAVEAGLRMLRDGADILDIGGESTRPGADTVTVQEEINRVLPAIRELRRQTTALISIDTVKAPVAKAALEAGADIVNDVSALERDPDMAEVLRKTQAGCVLMHMRGVPATMQKLTQYDNIVADVSRELARALAQAVSRSGLDETFFMLDPGIGFAKKPLDNPRLIAATPVFRKLGRPILIGPSRKRFIGDITGHDDPRNRVWGTAGAVAACVLNGADVVRVHDVAEMRDAVLVAEAVRKAARTLQPSA